MKAFFIFSFTFLVAFPSFAKIIIQNCDVNITRDNISNAIQLLAGNIDRLASEEFSYEIAFTPANRLERKDYLINLTTAEIADLKSTLFEEDVIIRCSGVFDYGCYHEKVGGYAVNHVHSQKRKRKRKSKVVLCEWEISTALGCVFYEHVAHELAHIANLPMTEYHDNFKSPRFSKRYQEDKVYQFGNAFANLCQEEGHAF